MKFSKFEYTDVYAQDVKVGDMICSHAHGLFIVETIIRKGSKFTFVNAGGEKRVAYNGFKMRVANKGVKS